MTTILDELTPTMRRVADAFNDEDRKIKSLILAAMRAHPKRRGELRAEWERRLLRIVREASK